MVVSNVQGVTICIYCSLFATVVPIVKFVELIAIVQYSAHISSLFSKVKGINK